MKVVPYSAIYVDLTLSYLFRNSFKAIKSQDAKAAQAGIESLFIQDPSREKLLVTICVRSGLDLLLQSLDYPPGTEILMSSMNIPDMVKVVRYHGLIPVPIDIDLDKLEPKMDVLEKSINKNTKAIILAWVFGSYNYADKIYKLCKEKGLFIIEDNAEAFYDLKYNGNSQANVSLFSFGTIKLNTALGGGVIIVREEILYRKMKGILDSYPQETLKFFFMRIIKGLLTMLALNNTTFNSGIRRFSTSLGVDYKEKAVSLVRGFHPSEDYLATFRKRLPDAMLVFLYLRMKSYDKGEFLKATQRQHEGRQMLESNGVIVPGTKADKKFFWLYPVIVPDQELCYKLLNKKGIDAYLGATQLKPVEAPIGSKYIEPKETIEFFNKILYMPIHKNVPLNVVKKICTEVINTTKQVEMMKRGKEGNKAKL